MVYRGIIVAALVCAGLISEASHAQDEKPPEFAMDPKGCKFVSPFEAGRAPAQESIVWSGECKDGYLSGTGTLSWPGGMSIKGDFTEGSLSSGELVYSGRYAYEGEFKGNRPDGAGTLQLSNGLSMKSTFSRGKSFGKVELRWSNGVQYLGEINHENQTPTPEGRGKMVYTNGAMYDGMWHKGQFEGPGVYTENTGTVRTGTFVAGQLNGESSIAYANGVNYRGQVKADDAHGKGVMEYVDGARYEGEFAAGAYNGQGVLKYADGSVLEAQFRAGSANGAGKLVYANGDVYEGGFLGGSRNGEGKFHGWDGSIREGTWKADQLAGQCFIKTRIVTYRGECLGGKRSGRGHLEDSSTNMTYDGEFRDDVVHGNGVLRGKDYLYEGEFKSGAKEGRGKETSVANGDFEGEFYNGARHGRGRFKLTLPQGTVLSYEGMFAAGELHGAGVLTIDKVHLDGEFETGVFIRGLLEADGRKFEVDEKKGSVFEVLPDGSKRAVGNEELPSYSTGI